jgi:hypothetical protein
VLYGPMTDEDFSSPTQVWSSIGRTPSSISGTRCTVATLPASIGSREWATTKPEVQRWVCCAEWDMYGPSAGPRRNARMVEWKPDVVIAFPGNRGTADMVRQAKAAEIPVHKVNL